MGVAGERDRRAAIGDRRSGMDEEAVSASSSEWIKRDRERERGGLNCKKRNMLALQWKRTVT